MTKNNPKAEWADWASPPTTITVMETEKHQRPLLYDHRGVPLSHPCPVVGFKPKH